jgi:hypothetical protein
VPYMAMEPDGEGAAIILIDSRVGSKHLAAMIPGSELVQLEFGDAAFEGNGVTVGIEVKRLMDAVQCMFSGRLADHQIPGLKASYDVVYLLIEGVYRPCPQSGVLQYLKLFPNESKDNVQCGRWVDANTGGRQGKRLMYGSFEQWLSTLVLNGGLHLKSTPCAASTAALISSLYAWWMRTDHKSFRVMDETTESVMLSRPSMIRRMVALLPNVGWVRSGILAQRFTGVEFHPNGDLPESWYIENQIAEGTANKIVDACLGRERNGSNLE